MDWKAFRDSLLSLHPEDMQREGVISNAVGLVAEGLAQLARVGHLYHLREGPAPPVGFPRLMFHLEAAPRGHPVFCQEDIEILGEGWFPTLAEAKHAKGMETQFRRGGVIPRRGPPALISLEELTPLDKERRRGY